MSLPDEPNKNFTPSSFLVKMELVSAPCNRHQPEGCGTNSPISIRVLKAIKQNRSRGHSGRDCVWRTGAGLTEVKVSRGKGSVDLATWLWHAHSRKHFPFKTIWKLCLLVQHKKPRRFQATRTQICSTRRSKCNFTSCRQNIVKKQAKQVETPGRTAGALTPNSKQQNRSLGIKAKSSQFWRKIVVKWTVAWLWLKSDLDWISESWILAKKRHWSLADELRRTRGWKCSVWAWTDLMTTRTFVCEANVKRCFPCCFSKSRTVPTCSTTITYQNDKLNCKERK